MFRNLDDFAFPGIIVLFGIVYVSSYEYVVVLSAEWKEILLESFSKNTFCSKRKYCAVTERDKIC